MNKFESYSKRSLWFIAFLLTAFVAGCGGGGDSGSGAGSIPAPGTPGNLLTPGAGTGAGPGGHGPAPVNLLSIAPGGGGNFVILTKAGITNVHTSAITGDIGASPITSAAMDNVFCSEMTGTIFGVDAAYTGSGAVGCFLGGGANKTKVDNAVLDMGTAYNDAAGRAAPDHTELGAGEIGGLTLPAGLYKWGTGVLITTDVTLDGGPNDVWIFQIAQSLTQANGKKVILTGGALAKNIFWQSFGVVSLGSTADFKGTILSKTSITLNTGANLNGRALAQTAVTLMQNTVGP